MTARYENRRWNRRGHRWVVDSQASVVENAITFEYMIPGAKPARQHWSVAAGYRRQNDEGIDSAATQLGGRWTDDGNGGLQTSFFVDFLREEAFDLGSTEKSLALGAAWTLRSNNTEARPLRGYRLQLELSGTHEALLSDASYTRADFAGKGIVPLFGGGRLITHGRVGRIVADDLDRVPLSTRFFSGGDASIRGFRLNEISPQDETGELIGGDRVSTFSVEGDWRVYRNFSAAVFLDTGSVSRSDFFDELERSYGLGVRWYSPLGPMRLDLAFPQDNDDRLRIHFSLGPDL